MCKDTYTAIQKTLPSLVLSDIAWYSKLCDNAAKMIYCFAVLTYVGMLG